MRLRRAGAQALRPPASRPGSPSPCWPTSHAAGDRRAGSGPAAQALVEGLLLGGYEFTGHKSEPSKTALAHVDLVVPDGDGPRRGRAGPGPGRGRGGRPRPGQRAGRLAHARAGSPGGPQLGGQGRRFEVKVLERRRSPSWASAGCWA